MNRRELKKTILAVLRDRELPEIFQTISPYQEHQLLNPLFIALCHQEERVRLHAVSCFGRLVPAMADRDPEAARVVMRRFLWSLNDESGGIGWGAPEAMAEIMCHSDTLRHEYLHMLISYMRQDGDELFQDGNFVELPMLQRGVLWGIGRLAQCHPGEMLGQHLSADLAAYLRSPDPQVAGLAVWALGLLGTGADAAAIVTFRGNGTEVRLYLDGILATPTVSQLAEQALRLIDSRAGITP